MFGKSYTGRDLVALRDEAIENVKQNNEDWADFNESSLQMQYLETLAGVVDMLNFYLDAQALETYLESAKQEKSIASILRMLNYNYDVTGAAVGTITVTRSPSEVGPDGEYIYLHNRIYIPKYTLIYSVNDSVPKFMVSESVMMGPDDIMVDVPIVQGQLSSQEFDPEDLKDSFKVEISDIPLDLKYVEIVNEGYEKVDDAFLETQGGKKYSVHYDSHNHVYILFTYDWVKYLPTEEKIVVRYIMSDGEAGNVPPFTLTQHGDTIINPDHPESDEFSITLDNTEATYGGFNTTDINIHKANAQHAIRAYDRIIILEDMEYLIRQKSWVKDVVCFDWRKDDTIVEYPYLLKAWVVTKEGPFLTLNVLRDLTVELQKKATVMQIISVQQAEFVELDLRINLTVEGSMVDAKEDIRQSVEEAVASWYTWDSYIAGDPDSRLKFGLKILIEKLKYDIAGLYQSITNVEFIGLEEDLYLTKTQFLYCESVVVSLE